LLLKSSFLATQSTIHCQFKPTFDWFNPKLWWPNPEQLPPKPSFCGFFFQSGSCFCRSPAICRSRCHTGENRHGGAGHQLMGRWMSVKHVISIHIWVCLRGCFISNQWKIRYLIIGESIGNSFSCFGVPWANQSNISVIENGVHLPNVIFYTRENCDSLVNRWIFVVACYQTIPTIHHLYWLLLLPTD
jgi:hypothetical protein